jgi:hypothetical protein
MGILYGDARARAGAKPGSIATAITQCFEALERAVLRRLNQPRILGHNAIASESPEARSLRISSGSLARAKAKSLKRLPEVRDVC